MAAAIAQNKCYRMYLHCSEGGFTKEETALAFGVPVWDVAFALHKHKQAKQRAGYGVHTARPVVEGRWGRYERGDLLHFGQDVADAVIMCSLVKKTAKKLKLNEQLTARRVGKLVYLYTRVGDKRATKAAQALKEELWSK